MTTTRHDHDDTRIDAREWEAQERARVDALAGTRVPGEDVEAQAYARIAQALRAPLPERLPSNFAFHVAQLAARLPRAARLDLRLERWLVRGLVAAMALGGLVTAAVYGAGWLRTLDADGAGAAGWALLLAACVLPTLGLEAWRALRNVGLKTR